MSVRTEAVDVASAFAAAALKHRNSSRTWAQLVAAAFKAALATATDDRDLEALRECYASLMNDRASLTDLAEAALEQTNELADG